MNRHGYKQKLKEVNEKLNSDKPKDVAKLKRKKRMYQNILKYKHPKKNDKKKKR